MVIAYCFTHIYCKLGDLSPLMTLLHLYQFSQLISLKLLIKNFLVLFSYVYVRVGFSVAPVEDFFFTGKLRNGTLICGCESFKTEICFSKLK